ncbi:MAG: alpha/beta hydrolase, partial [Clostridia bacterium]|nr:alpha/beta hydrolase [Clostridia bacterium]
MSEYIKMTQMKVRSSDGVHDLAGRLYISEKEPAGILQVVHGMTEHIARYDDFMRRLASEGYVVFGYDHIGHGMTALNDNELGFIAHKNGWQFLVDDVDVFASAVRAEYGTD